jgi:hypothetical protein
MLVYHQRHHHNWDLVKEKDKDDEAQERLSSEYMQASQILQMAPTLFIEEARKPPRRVILNLVLVYVDDRCVST